MRCKGWVLLLSLFLVFSAAGCGSGREGQADRPTDDQAAFSAGMVTDTGGLNDESFNQTAWEGMKRLEKELGVNVRYLESKRNADYVPNLSHFAREGRDIIWGLGYKFENAIPQVARQFGNAKFGIVDSNLGGNIPPNVVAVTFKEHEGSFLMGVIAGLTTKTDKVGFIGGISSPLIKKFEVGYRAGVKAVNPEAEVKVAYAESFEDVAKGRSLAQNMYNSGVDVIYHAAGGVGKGLFNEVKTREKGKYWAIGVDMDQSPLAPDHTLSSMIKRVDVAVYEVTKQLKENKFQGGKEVVLGLKENGVDIAETTGRHVPDEVLKRVEDFRQKIISGEIKVPSTDEELNSFQ